MTHIERFCNPSEGKPACKYLFVSNDKFVCTKLIPLEEPALFIQAYIGTEGDNCEGVKNLQKHEKNLIRLGQLSEQLGFDGIRL